MDLFRNVRKVFRAAWFYKVSFYVDSNESRKLPYFIQGRLPGFAYLATLPRLAEVARFFLGGYLSFLFLWHPNHNIGYPTKGATF